ncbi:hypothetical protein CAPTEDRAFT_216273 [Capitella teleta]|uniref:Uncharacterized protein n=1 Tax=Capitella teleta TaxID=283909 RepID=R7U993_CAPTE|nr:hypothetical protein CAPTEDRAFT_216273 [Capitella teleta]|eukprot:ELU02711.1 hypothetical protein CAPTEDRAFT_216273 [Capitella teleta]
MRCMYIMLLCRLFLVRLGKTRSSMSSDLRGPINTPQSRQRSLTTISSSGTWNTLVPRFQRKMYMEAIMHNPTNHHVKAPFKQLAMNDEENTLQIVPEQVLKERTAKATYLVARAMAKQQTLDQPKPQGKLLKGKLKPLYPVSVQGPTIKNCRGVVSEARTYSASPSRTFQRRRRILNNMSQDVFERPQTTESIHQTSIASDLSENRERDLKEDLDAIDKENPGPGTTGNQENPGPGTMGNLETEDTQTQPTNPGKNSGENDVEDIADKFDTKSVRFFMNGESEKESEERKLIEDFQEDNSAPYDGSCEKDPTTEQLALDTSNDNWL